MFVIADISMNLPGGLSLDGSTGVLNDILRGFTQPLDAGAQKIVDVEATVCGSLMLLQMMKLVLEFGISPGTFVKGFFGFLGAYVWYELARNGVSVANAWMSGMGDIGSWFSGGGYTGDVMHNPSSFVVLGLKADDVLVQKAMSYSNPFTAIVALVIYSIAGLFVTLGFCGLGVTAIIVAIKASFDVVLGLALLPFMIERQFVFVGARGLGMIIDGGLSIAATSICCGVSYGMLTAPLPPDPDFATAIVLAIKAFACFAICGGIAWMTKGIGTAMGISRMFA